MTGLEIHLSWSLFQLIGALILWATWAWLGFSRVKVFSTKVKLVSVTIGLLFVLYAAFDVGARQSSLDRQAFDSQPPAVIAEKVEKEQVVYWRTLADMNKRREEIKSQQEGE